MLAELSPAITAAARLESAATSISDCAPRGAARGSPSAGITTATGEPSAAGGVGETGDLSAGNSRGDELERGGPGGGLSRPPVIR